MMPPRVRPQVALAFAEESVRIKRAQEVLASFRSSSAVEDEELCVEVEDGVVFCLQCRSHRPKGLLCRAAVRFHRFVKLFLRVCALDSWRCRLLRMAVRDCSNNQGGLPADAPEIPFRNAAQVRHLFRYQMPQFELPQIDLLDILD
jgi:hypothetical protein